MLHDLAGVVVDGKPLCISCAERAGHDLTKEQQHAGRVLFTSELEGDTHCASCGHCFDHPECGKPLFTVERIKPSVTHYQVTHDEVRQGYAGRAGRWIDRDDRAPMLCLTGDGHAEGARDWSAVDCPTCLSRRWMVEPLPS